MNRIRYLITGASGFLGTAIKGYLEKESQVITLGRSEESNLVADILGQIPSLPDCDVVVHAAGLAHMVPQNVVENQSFFDVNFRGTINLCEAVQKMNVPIRSFIFISSVSVYGLEKGTKVTENAPLKGESPYARSKIEAEAYLTKWADEQNINLVILRLPLVVGSRPVGNLAKMIEAMKAKRYLNIGGGRARKSMVLADDIATLIPRLIGIDGIFNLTDMHDPSFKELTGVVCSMLGIRMPLNLPLFVATPLGWIGDLVKFLPVNSSLVSKMVCDLTFDSRKARDTIGWQPRKVLVNLNCIL